MVTFAQAQERAEEWINGDVPGYQQREVRVREFGLGFVVWAEDRAGGPVSAGGRQRLVIARDSGEATLWPGLPVGEVIRRYEEEYGVSAAAPEPSVPPQRIDAEQTSFILSPPEWLQEAADRAGIAPRAEAPAAPAVPVAPVVPAAPAAPAVRPVGETPWAGTDVNAGSDDVSVPLPATVFAPPLSGTDLEGAPVPAVSAEARTQLLSGGSQLPATAIAPALGAGPRPGSGAAPAAPPAPAPVPAAPAPASSVPGSDIADAPTSKARVNRPSPSVPPGPPGVPGAPGAGQPPAPPGPPGAPGGSAQYAATMLAGPAVSQPPAPPGPPGAPGAPGGSGGGQAQYAATMLAGPAVSQPPAPPGPPGAPGAPGAGQPPTPPGPPGAPGGGAVQHAATMLAGPAVSQPPAPPGPPGAPGGGAGAAQHAATMLAGPGAAGRPPAPPGPVPQAPQPPQAQSHAPQQPGVPTVGPGYQAVLRYRGQDGSEQQLIRRSAPGTPHPEWQILHELRAMGVPPQQVLELHTELESCELPGGYCARMIRETWPQVRITSVAPYGTDHAGRQQGMRHLLTHQGELHQVADGPARPAPVRAPLPQVPLEPAIPLEAIASELTQAFGPQGVFRFEQRAVSRQGVPEIVAQTLVWSGLPVDFGPFFWAQAVPGQPVPTLAEMAAQRQVQPAPDAGSYLVVGSDFGKAICVQYGTAHIVAVPVEAGPGGGTVAPQFVNSSLPQFARSLAMLGYMWRLRMHLTPDQAGRWTSDFQMKLAALDSAALASPENWWSVLLEQMWDGLL
ncbi:SUKH-4 family immunity protein [Streptomyces sp. NPDC098789]|uniref:SUKH-4 family immunity protein n=1 Tax=Streptomyces sp. NPDC098789 TaxID=3366098 RepID=UPI00382AEB7B